MRIIIESHIPFIKGIAEAAGHRVEYLEPDEFTPERVKDADALIVRTRTKCDAKLLDGSKVKQIATATIGTDHIDLEYCRRNGIMVHNAPGCNAPAVAQYVLSAIARLKPQCKCLGIVGVGHVGSIVERWARANGLNVMLCDPPRAAAESPEKFVSLDEIARQCDVITFHVPLDQTTRHMINDRLLNSATPDALIINASRGPVADTQALLRCPQTLAIDCWEGEPEINLDLLRKAEIATPHIAGYSLEGKQRATAMAIHSILPDVNLTIPPIADEPSLSQIAKSYNPFDDTKELKENPSSFELLRNNYDYRPEPISE
ncbi:MAG: 4-phosphoerythronate dehydrogenase [Bacteroides sp.]|nr:4-phosphoerythronate dehydrogenase [Bacteroides sp.]